MKIEKNNKLVFKLKNQLIENAKAISRNRHMSIDISSACDVGCIFCFNENEIPGTIKRMPFVNSSDLSKILSYVNPEKYDNVISIGAGDKIWWGDPLAHPNIMSIINQIRSSFPSSEIHFDTSGYYMKKEMIGLLRDKKLKISLSINTLDFKTRRQFMLKPDMRGIELLLNEVPIEYAYLKYFGNENILIEDVIKLYEEKKVKNICIYKLHYTKFNSNLTKIKIKKTQTGFYQAIYKLYHAYKYIKPRVECQWLDNEIDNQSILCKGHTDFIDMIIECAVKISGAEKFIIMTGDSAYNYIKEKIGGNNTICIQNCSYEGSITSAGLLMISDFLKTLSSKNIQKGIDYYLPSEVIDESGYDRKGHHINELYQLFNKKRARLIDLHKITYVY